MEHYTKEWIRSRFPDGSGSFFKCEGKLAWACDTWCEKYEEEYDFKEGDEKEGKEKLITLLQVIRDSSPTNISALEAMFDIEMFLRTFSVELLTSNWDGILNGKNFDLYWNPETKKWVYIRHDLDLAMIMTTAQLPIWIKEEEVRVAWLVTQSPKWQPRFRELLLLGLSHMQGPEFQQEVHALHDLALPLIESDTWRGVDSPNSLFIFNGGPGAILGWVEKRIKSVMEQLAN